MELKSNRPHTQRGGVIGDINIMYANVGNDLSLKLSNCDSAHPGILSTADITYVQLARCLNIMMLNPQIDMFVFAEFCASKVSAMLSLLSIMCSDTRQFGVYLHAQNRDTKIYKPSTNLTGFHPHSKDTDLYIDNYFKYFGIVYNKNKFVLNAETTSKIMSLDCFGKLLLTGSTYSVDSTVNPDVFNVRNLDHYTGDHSENGISVQKLYNLKNITVHTVERSDYNVNKSINVQNTVTLCLGQYCQLAIFNFAKGEGDDKPFAIVNPHLLGTVSDQSAWIKQIKNIRDAIDSLACRYIMIGDLNVRGHSVTDLIKRNRFDTTFMSIHQYNNIVLASGFGMTYISSDEISATEDMGLRIKLPVIIPFSNHTIIFGKYATVQSQRTQINSGIIYPRIINYENSAFNIVSNELRESLRTQHRWEISKCIAKASRYSQYAAEEEYFHIKLDIVIPDNKKPSDIHLDMTIPDSELSAVNLVQRRIAQQKLALTQPSVTQPTPINIYETLKEGLKLELSKTYYPTKIREIKQRYKSKILERISEIEQSKGQNTEEYKNLVQLHKQLSE
jgi:hypothetical protein